MKMGKTMKRPVRTFLLAGAALCCALQCAAMGAIAQEDYAMWVDPLVGTVGEGNTFPGSCRPFGLVQASPDTGTKVHCPGYKYDDTVIRGFSQTHLNGTGRPAMGDVLILPFSDEWNDAAAFSPFSHETEVASPDYYAVTLERGGIRCEATTTKRVAWWRFTYPKGAAKKLYVDGNAMLMQPYNLKFGPRLLGATSTLLPDTAEIRGFKHGRGWSPYKLYYSLTFSRTWSAAKTLPADAFDGAGERYVLEFGGEEPVEVRIALSVVSEDGAVRNRDAETKGETFETVRAANRREWNELLGRLTLEKGTDEQKRSWYTALYHLLIQPNEQTDADGRYRTADDRIATAKRGHYSTFSLWDTFRAAHPLYTLLCPERIYGFVDSMLAVGRDHGHLPMWTMWENDDHGMIGIHSIPVIVDAWAKGFRDFDATEALRLMVKSMIGNDGENPVNCWNAYWENGYFPYKPGVFDKHLSPGGSVSRTLEFAYDWWCIAHFAELLGDVRTQREAQKWADCWRNVFDANTGFARPRAPKIPDGGAWREPFDPRLPRVPGAFWGDYTEANSWIYTWHVFQAPDALAAAMGGREKTVAKLDEFFTTPPVRGSYNRDEGGASEDGRIKDGQVGQYWHGNEPSHHIAYFYSLLGAREKTARLVRAICRDAYQARPDGLCGNDDCGQMSAWYLFSMMGFYPFNPCDDGYVVGAPQAEEMRLSLPGGKSLKIVAKGLSEKAFCVTRLTLDGEEIKGHRIPHGLLMRGGELVFEMGEAK